MVQVGLTHFWSGELGDLLTDELAAERKPTILELLARAIAENTDPVLSFAHIQSDLGICRGTFFRQVRHSLPILRSLSVGWACGSPIMRHGNWPGSNRGLWTDQMHTGEVVAGRGATPHPAGEDAIEYSVLTFGLPVHSHGELCRGGAPEAEVRP